MKVVADTNIAYVREAFAEFGEVSLVTGRDLTPAQVRDADILLVRSVTRVDAHLLGDSRVRFVSTATSGVDHVDQDYLAHRGIAFASAPGSNARSVAEYVLSAVLILMEGRGRRLADVTAAIVGCGHVGAQVAHVLTAAGIRCLLNDPPLKDLTGEARFRGLDEVLSADIVTLHVPLTTTGRHPTYRLFDEAVLSRLQPDAILINTARGGVVDEWALLHRLDRQPTMAVVVDCWEGEPNINTELLAKAGLATSHIAGYSFDGKVRATEMLYRAACQHFGRSAAWIPPTQPEGGFFHFSKEMGDEEILRRAVLSCYDAREDSAALKRALAISPGKLAGYFDSLRRDYRRRREFSTREISLPHGWDRLAKILEGIGFKMSQVNL